jgi:hypothetical protein
MYNSTPLKICIFASFAFIFVGCTSTKPVLSDRIDESADSELIFDELAVQIDLDKYRIKPESVFISLDNSIPEEFQVEVGQTAVASPSSGFRIQIISTVDVSIAERLQREFIEWQDIELTAYDAETYLQFRQPFYRLHVGNFTSRALAIEFSREVKRKFPDAWVVFDTIDPTQLTIKKVQ